MKTITNYIKTCFIVAMAWIALSSTINAQTDSTAISYSEENANSSNFNYRRKYQYLDFDQITEKNLMKAGVSALNANTQFYFGYERKVLKDISLFLELTNEKWEQELDLGCRYYFLMRKKIKKGISGNNFSGVYICPQINISYNRREEHGNIIPARISLGIQKRLNWFSYIDANIFVGSADYHENYGYIVGINGRMGLAWGWGNK